MSPLVGNSPPSVNYLHLSPIPFRCLGCLINDRGLPLIGILQFKEPSAPNRDPRWGVGGIAPARSPTGPRPVLWDSGAELPPNARGPAEQNLCFVEAFAPFGHYQRATQVVFFLKRHGLTCPHGAYEAYPVSPQTNGIFVCTGFFYAFPSFPPPPPL